ncbi:unnamed protein product [Orchesella dallaii]|uniref:Potassium channel domain-containing protein n=1 Tax=Orchesella dallaii TaxID=48710 RepID=A0ABP1S3M3_9HEXA
MSRSGSGSAAGGGGSSAGRMSDLARRRGLSIDIAQHSVEDDDVNDEEDEEASEKGKCARCMSACKSVTTFLLSHVGLISLVVGYCIMGAFTFEALESSHEIQVKRNMTKVREAVTHYLWVMTKNADVIKPDVWVRNTTHRLQEFETALLKAMKKDGWDGSENEDSQQWTFSGALFYSIVVITTIGYGHISPKTVWGKVVTIFYAILGIPLMLLCLSHIGDFLANAFRFVYWKVCCYMCTRRSRVIIRRHPASTFRRSRSLRTPGTSKYPRRAHSDEDVRRPAQTMKPVPPMTMRIPKSASGSAAGLATVSASSAVRHLQIMEPPPQQIRYPQHPRNIQRSTRSAEPAIVMAEAGESFKLPVLCNRYAEDVVISDESEVRRGPSLNVNVGRFRQPQQELYVGGGDYWEDEVVEDYIVYGSDDIPKNRPVPIWLCVVLVLSYILFGAFLFSGWERWNYLDSAYFCFITLTTIGFGDFVPAQRDSSQVSIALCSLYLLFGISLLAMSFNLVQEEVISSVKLVATRLGIIKEDDA